MTTVVERPFSTQPDPPEPADGEQRVPPPPRPDPDRPVHPRAYRLSDVGELVGSILSALCLTWLLFFRLTPLFGAVGFAVVWFVLFLPIYAMVEREVHGKLVARDRLATVLMTTGGLAAIIPLAFIIGYTIQQGIQYLRWNFFTDDLSTTGPLDPATAGGALHAIVGTLQQVGIAIILSVPLGVITAIYLNEIGGRMARIVRFVIDAMSGLPSIVAGLFIYAIWVLRFGFSGFAAALALAVLMLPTITRTTEEMLRLVPDGLREASLALGAPQWRTVLKVVLPTARTGIVTAVILGTARAIGETAPVLLTAFGAKTLNVNPFAGAQDNLPLFVYFPIRSSEPADVSRAWVGALVLITLVLILFTLARLIGGRQTRTRGVSAGWGLRFLPGRRQASDPETVDGVDLPPGESP
jgi:phosphate transport system permease protein